MVAPVVARPRRGVLLGAAACDLVALAGLLLLAAGAYLRGDALILVFAAAPLGLAAIPGAVLSGIVLRRAARARGIGTLPTAIAIAALAACAPAIGPAVLVGAWAATPNPADAVLRPSEDVVRALGGRQLCTNGDPGLGPDNTAPWRQSYFSVPASAAIVPRLTARAAQDGFVLRPRAGRDSPFADATRSSADRHRAGERPATLTVEVAPSGTALRCGDDYGRIVRPAAGRVVVDLQAIIDAAD